MYWPDLQLPPINLWNAPKRVRGMKIYLVFQTVDYEGWYFFKAFDSPEKAWRYKKEKDSELRDYETDVSFVVQEEEVE